jgi:hypothetical protein
MTEFTEANVINLVKTIRISDLLYKIIEERYNSISLWLNRDDSTIKEYNPLIYPQGSVRIGMAIQPLNNGSYDIDLVCELKNLKKTDISPFLLKKKLESKLIFM